MSKKEIFQLDEKIDDERIMQFATQINSVPHGLIKDLEKGFDGNHSLDFYHGMLSGLAAAYSAATHEEYVKKNQVEGTIGAMVAFIASELKEKIE